MFHRRRYDKKTGIYNTKCDIKNFKINLEIRTLFSLIEIPDFDHNDVVTGSQNEDQEMEKWTIKWQEKIFSYKELEYYRQEMEFKTDSEKTYSQMVKEIETEANLSKIRIFTICHEDQEIQKWTREPEVTDNYSNKIEEPENLKGIQKFKILCEYSDEVKCLISFSWNSKDKALIVYPDFNNFGNPYIIEFDQSKGGQMFLFNFNTITKRRGKKIQKIIRQPTLPIFDYENVPRNSFKVLLLMCLETAFGFDYENLHFKYCLKSSESQNKTEVYSTQSSSFGGKRTLIFFHTFEQDFQFTYKQLDLNPDLSIILYVEGFSVDSWDRERYHGFSRLRIPITNLGSNKHQIRFVREIKNGNMLLDSLERFFIGGHRKFDREAFSEESSNRMGTWTKSSGVLNINYSLLIQHDNRHFNKKISEIQGPAKFDQIASIVQKFKKICQKSKEE